MQSLQDIIDGLTLKQLRELRTLLGADLIAQAAALKAPTASPSGEERPVMVTTEHRGVFFGYTTTTDEEALAKNAVRLRAVRNCVYWSADLRGFGGLAVVGPNSNCKVGPSIPSAQVLNITGIWDVTPEAAKAWEQAPWDK